MRFLTGFLGSVLQMFLAVASVIFSNNLFCDNWFYRSISFDLFPVECAAVASYKGVQLKCSDCLNF